MDECERLTAAGEAFEVRDVHDIQVDFFKLLDDKYGCSYILIGTTVKVTPRISN
jgi:hypothetical protein